MKNLSEWLNVEDFHDNYITGVKAMDDKTVILDIRDENGFMSKIVFSNTYHMRIDNFCLCNIIFSIDIYESDEIDKLENKLIHMLDLNMNDVHKSRIYNNYRKSFIDNKLLFVYIDPTCGLSGYFLCEDIKVID